MKKIEINSKKQTNGLWGMPFNCIKINKMEFYHDNHRSLLSSALIMAINEKFNRKFEVWFNDDYLSVNMVGQPINDSPFSFSVSKLYTVYFKNYEVIDNTLYEFDNNKEKISFMRKQKINKLKLC